MHGRWTTHAAENVTAYNNTVADHLLAKAPTKYFITGTYNYIMIHVAILAQLSRVKTLHSYIAREIQILHENSYTT